MIKSFILPNGITCVCEERPQTGKVTMQVFIDSGGADESPSEQGLTNLTQEACFGGTKTRSRTGIADEVESRGGSMGSQVSRRTTSFKAICLTRNTQETFDVMADVIRNPSFDPKEIDRARAQIDQGLVAADQHAEEVAGKKFMETAFAGQGFGADPAGDRDLLASFTPQQVKDRHKAMLSDPSSIVISFSGDISLEDATALATKYFGDIPPATPAPLIEPKFTGGEYREGNNNDQLNILLGFPAPGSNDDDRFAVMMLQNLLAGGMSTPLFQELREKRSLVYTPGASYDGTPGDGIFTIEAGTGKGKAGELVEVTIDLLGKIAREGFSDEEIKQARGRIMRSMSAARENAMTSGAINAMQLIERGRLISPEETELRLKQVTNEDIRRVCCNMLKDGNFALSALGPQDTLPSGQQIKDLMAKAMTDVAVPPEKSAAVRLQQAFIGAALMHENHEAAPKMTVLPNGLKIITVERPGPLSCGAWVGVGSDNETPQLSGATHMNEHMMFKGTPHYAPGDIDRVTEGELGAQLNAYTTKDKTCYYFYNLQTSGLERVVDMCGQMVFFANIDDGEYAGRDASAGKPAIKGEREAVYEEMRMCNDDVKDKLHDQLEEAAYSGQSHGRPILGTEASLGAISAAQLRAYRDEFYAPNNVIFCATGPVKHEDFVTAVEAKYGQLKPSQFPPLPLPVWQGGLINSEAEKATLCNVMIAAEGVSRTDPDFFAYNALATLLTDGDSSIMHRRIVDELQLTSHVDGGLLSYRNCGEFLIVAEATPDKVLPLLNEMYASMRDLADNITAADLDKVKATMEMGVLAGLEKNRAACDRYAVDAQAHGRLVLPAEVSEAIQKLTVEDIKRVAAKVLASNPAVSMVVPPGTDPAMLPGHDDVVRMRDGNYLPLPAQRKAPDIKPSAP